MNVGIHRHVIIGKIVGHEPPETMVGRGLLMQRHSDAADHRADNLTACDFRIKDAAGRDRADHPRDPNDAKLLIDLDLGEYRRVGVAGSLALLIRFGSRLLLDPIGATRAHRVYHRDLATCFLFVPDLAFGEDHVVNARSRKR